MNRHVFEKLFAREIALGAGNHPVPVCVQVRMSKNDNAYGAVVGSQCRVSFMPARGFHRTGDVHVYWNSHDMGDARENWYFGIHPRTKIQALIKRFGSQHRRDLRAAMVDVGIRVPGDVFANWPNQG